MVSGTIAAMSAAFGTTLTLSPARTRMAPGKRPTGTGPAACPCPPSWPGSSPPCSASTTGPVARPQFRRAARRPAHPGDGTKPEDGTGGADPRPPRRAADRAAGRQLLPLPGGHRRDRADHRDHRARRRLHPGRPGHVLLRPRPRHPVGDRGRRRRRVQLPRAAARTARSSWTSRWPARSRRSAAQLVYFARQHRPGLHQRDRPGGARHADPDRGLDQLGPVRRPVVRSRAVPRWTACSRTRRRSA